MGALLQERDLATFLRHARRHVVGHHAETVVCSDLPERDLVGLVGVLNGVNLGIREEE